MEGADTEFPLMEGEMEQSFQLLTRPVSHWGHTEIQRALRKHAATRSNSGLLEEAVDARCFDG